MRLKLFVTTVLLFITISFLHAQKVKLKSNKVYLDGKEIMSYKHKSGYGEFYYYKLNTTEEQIFLRLHDNNTSYEGDDYSIIYFPQFDKKMETTSQFLGRFFLKPLIEFGVIDSNGNIVPEKVDEYIKRYGENISGK